MKYLIIMLVVLTSTPTIAGHLNCAKLYSEQGYIAECQEFQKEDATLNKQYQRLLRAISKAEHSSETHNSLIEAQRAWIISRDKDCEITYWANYDGTIRWGEQLECLISHTRERTAQLAEIEKSL